MSFSTSGWCLVLVGGVTHIFSKYMYKSFYLHKEEDATVWARYSSAQFEQGAGRHACNNPYDRRVDEEAFAAMNSRKIWEIPHETFLKLINPSFCGVDDDEDMAAILARTHLIVLTDNGIYYRVAATSTSPVPFIEWEKDQPKDLLVPSYHAIFKAYKLNPSQHQLPDCYHEDCAWSQEMLRRLLNGETIPRSHTIRTPTSPFGERRLWFLMK